MQIRPETEADWPGIRNVNRSAFESDSEADLVDALRAGGFAELSLVAVIDGVIVGHVLFGPVAIVSTQQAVTAISLAPLAVMPSHQCRGIGGQLTQTGLHICREQGHRIAVVLGHPEYYRRFGFQSDLAKPLQNPFGAGEAWMAQELVPGALDGIQGHIEYPPPFAEL